mgnify:CR=1 FL=1
MYLFPAIDLYEGKAVRLLKGEYDKMTIPEKNESLKSIIERITYYKTKRLNWRKKEDDDMVICIDMKL